MTRVLVVGYGSIGKRHLRIIRDSLPKAKIMVLRHQTTHELPAFADYVTSSINDVFSFAPELAVIASPAPFHLDVASQLVDFGCHLLIEKPLSNKVEGVSLFLDKIESTKVTCQIGYNLRFLPSLREFRSYIHEGLIGEPLSIRCDVGEYLPYWRSETDYRHGVSASRKLGGGVLLELSHEIDYLRWIFGEIQWVSGWIGHVSNLVIDVEDIAHLVIGFNSEEPNKEIVASLNMDFIRHDKTRSCTVIGTDGSLRWNGLSGVVEIIKPKQNTWNNISVSLNGYDFSYREQWNSFMSCVRNKTSPLVDVKSAIETLRVIESALASAYDEGKRMIIHRKY